MSPYDPRPEGLNTQPAPPSAPPQIGANDELAKMTRMFGAAYADLGLINEALDLDPDDGGAEPILEAIAELKAQVPQWIPVSEQLPEPEIDVLVRKQWGEAVYHDVAGLFHGEWESQVSQDGCKHTVTHWMPLPVDPHEEQNNG
ncbi:DUF551 domain-containing protein [Pandoraea terrigena]|uniref:DUF551 domain-containing protein n=1 Tax=Pandoraea terrigena TaxID=2508292 RepID=A0A5E4YNG4_9BURK|nr:DUF551 domain-containing protein [Pandoraea terrigena]VVE50057.1 hypothetical protein PTE31013_04666 [Pandoraea terrigena]